MNWKKGICENIIQGPGEVSEWLIELVSKTSVPYCGTAGSNPALSVGGSKNEKYEVN